MKTTIEIYPYGVLVKAPVPLNVAGKIGEIASIALEEDDSKLFMDTALGRRLGGFAICTANGAKKWTEELNKQPIPRVTGLAWLDEWIDRGEVGVSSATIASHFGGVPMHVMVSSTARAPLDADDFQRCMLFLDLAAKNGDNWLDRIATEPPPGFAKIAPHWEELTRLYRQEKHKEVSELIRSIK